ncbi:hypothetical protein [Paraburkholderia antibiotica]|uniref:Uncharacterized protein n=1 Tax=Paraburkholderia antibiotica TaxID=2728839 RepID=A0A7Y0A127_9BURK|nr:hypothetical protein [Paraburkholderia antibiotica]NML34575.1 hypothetical protein [Paraburkholderia antibiotica]
MTGGIWHGPRPVSTYDVPRGGGAVQYFEEQHDLEDKARKFAEPAGTPQAGPATTDAGVALPSLAGPTMAALGSAAPVASTVSSAAQSVASGGVAALGKQAVSALEQQARGQIASGLSGVSGDALAHNPLTPPALG